MTPPGADIEAVRRAVGYAAAHGYIDARAALAILEQRGSWDDGMREAEEIVRGECVGTDPVPDGHGPSCRTVKDSSCLNLESGAACPQEMADAIAARRSAGCEPWSSKVSVYSDMKILDGARGDCMIACLASVLGEPYDHRFDEFREQIESNKLQHWLERTEAFAAALGWHMKWDTMPENVPDVPTIAGGKSPRGVKTGHGVVMFGATGTVIHDPHPSRAGLAGEAEQWIWFEPIAERRSAGKEQGA